MLFYNGGACLIDGRLRLFYHTKALVRTCAETLTCNARTKLCGIEGEVAVVVAINMYVTA